MTITRLLLTIVLLFTFLSCQDETAKKQASGRTTPPSEKETIIHYDSLISTLEELKHDPNLQSASLGYFIVDVTNQEPIVIAEHHAKTPLIPASTLKIFVTGAALEIFGPSIIKEVTITNMMSVNWRSSKLLRKIGREKFNNATTNAGAKAILEFWQDKGVETEGMVFDDGNGLSRNNAISPKQLVDALYAMRTSPYYLAFYESLPLAGMTGTLRKAMKGTVAEGRVRAKTGTIASVKSFAGYARSVTGRKLIFSIIVNNYGGRVKPMKKKLEAVMVEIATL